MSNLLAFYSTFIILTLLSTPKKNAQAFRKQIAEGFLCFLVRSCLKVTHLFWGMVDAGRAEVRSGCVRWRGRIPRRENQRLAVKNEQTTCRCFVPERHRKNIKTLNILGSQTHTAEVKCTICQHNPFPCVPAVCLPPGPADAAGLPGTRVWRHWGKIYPQDMSRRNSTREAAVHTDKPITSSELIVLWEHDNTNIPRTETSLFLWLAAVLRVSIKLSLVFKSARVSKKQKEQFGTMVFICI